MGPQPDRKTIRRPWRHITDLQAGDVLSYPSPAGGLFLFRVLRVDDHRVGAAPIIAWLDWSGTSVPGRWRLSRLQFRMGRTPALGGPMHAETFRVARIRKKDPDWQEAGFKLVAKVAPRPDDAVAQARTYTAWPQLSKSLQRRLSG